MNKNKLNKGFTVLELMIVLAIIGIIWTAVSAISRHYHEPIDCSIYSHSVLNEVPVSCFDYYGIESQTLPPCSDFKTKVGDTIPARCAKYFHVGI